MIDCDSPWKNVLERYFPEFLAFFFPAAYAGIDWSQGYTFLDKELQKVVRDATLGRRYADILARVIDHAGVEDWVLVHIEVQGQHEADFGQRMFVYNYRLYDRYAKPVVSLAVLTNSHPNEYGEFGYQRWGSRMELRFPVVSLPAYRVRWAELDASTNPFAIVTQAHLAAQQTAGAEVERYQGKLTLIRHLYHRGYPRQDILELFRFIDWVLALPEGLEERLWKEVQEFEEEKHMRYVSSFERIAQRKGMEKGMEKGISQGQIALLRRLLVQRFGPLPQWAEAQLNQAAPAQLELWGERLLDAERLEAIFSEG